MASVMTTKCQRSDEQKVPPYQTSVQGEGEKWRRACGCMKTSEKLKQILLSFPTPPPPSPLGPRTYKPMASACISSCCSHSHDRVQSRDITCETECSRVEEIKEPVRTRQVLAALVSVLQLSVTATALALYYLIYCYMQLVYFTLKSALYFHNADGPMKITIGVITLTSLVVGFNILMRIERFIGIGLFTH